MIWNVATPTVLTAILKLMMYDFCQLMRIINHSYHIKDSCEVWDWTFPRKSGSIIQTEFDKYYPWMRIEVLGDAHDVSVDCVVNATSHRCESSELEILIFYCVHWWLINSLVYLDFWQKISQLKRGNDWISSYQCEFLMFVIIFYKFWLIPGTS